MNTKELLLDFLKVHYKENPLRRQITNEHDVEDYLRQQNLQQCDVRGSLPSVADETATEPIQNALYATGKFTTDDCSTLADGILQYIKDAGMNIVGGIPAD